MTAINKQRTFQIIIPLVLLLAACNESVSSNPITTSVSGDKPQACTEDAQRFWLKFRSAVLKDDMNAIADMTRFPLEVGISTLDEKPLFITRAEFRKLFPKFSDTEKTLARATDKLPPSACIGRGRHFYVGEWLFGQNPITWQLVYAETDEL